MSALIFTLTDSQGSVTFTTDNVKNWEEVETSLTRSKSKRGNVRKLTNTFEFVNTKDLKLRNRIMDRYAEKKTKAFTTLKIELSDDNLDRFSFQSLGSGYPYRADYNSYDVTETGVLLTFEDSRFQQLIASGEKEKLSIITNPTLVNTEPTDYNNLLKSIWCHDRELEFNSNISLTLGDDTTYAILPGAAALNCQPVFKSDDNIKFITTQLDFSVNDPKTEELFYLISERDRSINFRLKLRLFYIDNNHIEIRLAKYEGSDGNYTLLDNSLIYDTGVFSGFIDIDESLVIDIQEGQSLALFTINIGLIAYGVGEESFYTLNSIETQPNGVTNTRNCLLPHEFFTHWIELMTGEKNAFYSEYFGRTDLGYAQDGEGAYLAFMDGFMLRNMPIEEYPFTAKFKDMVEDAIKEKNLVASIEYIGDKEVYRIEKYTDQFKTEVKGDIGELISDYNLVINDDLTYGSIKVGSKDIESEDLNGLNSPHGEVNYSTPLSVDNELDLVTKWYKNDYAIEQQRRLQFSIAPDEDGKNDKKIFVIDSLKGATTDVLAKTNQGYDSIEGILSPNKAYNLDLVPSHQVRLWGSVINGCLQKEQDEQLILTKSASNNTLITQKTGENDIVEKDNIDISELDTPIIINEIINIGDAAQTRELYNTIESNPNNAYEVTIKGVRFFCFIDENNYKVPENKGNFKLLRTSR